MSDKLRRSKPTNEQLKQWDDTRAALMWYCPHFIHMFYTLMSKDDEHIAVFTDEKRIPWAATDGSSVILNTGPKGFFKFSLLERLFVVCHEILHNILNHIILLHGVIKAGKVTIRPGVVLDLDLRLFQLAMDYVINAILVASKIGKMPDVAAYDLSIATAMDSVLEVYEKMFRKKYGGNKKPPGDKPGKPGNQPPPPGGDDDEEDGDQPSDGDEPSGFDEHLEPGTVDGKTPHEAIEEHDQGQWDTVIKAAVESARAAGKLPAVLERLLVDLVETKVDWKDRVQSFFARKVGSGAWNWRKPDRKLIIRDIWAPGPSGFGCDLIVLACDTSGSIWAVPKVMDKWFGAVGEILEQLRPKRLIVIWCDAGIGKVDEIEEASDVAALRSKGVPGGGGTSFVPVFDYIWDNRLEPDALVYLTDGWGTFPSKIPGYPVLWGALENTLDPKNYPFGEVVVIPSN